MGEYSARQCVIDLSQSRCGFATGEVEFRGVLNNQYKPTVAFFFDAGAGLTSMSAHEVIHAHGFVCEDGLRLVSSLVLLRLRKRCLVGFQCSLRWKRDYAFVLNP